MRSSADISGSVVTIVTPGVILQPLFLTSAKVPEFRLLAADWGVFAAAGTIRPQTLVPGLNNTSGSHGTIPRDGMNSLFMLFGTDDSGTATAKTAMVRVTLWYQVRNVQSQVLGAQNLVPDVFIPVAQVYSLTFDETTNPTLGATTNTVTAGTDFASGIASVVGPGEPHDDFYAPALSPAATGAGIGWLRIDMHGASYVTIEVAGATAGATGTPVTNCQVFYGFE